VSEATEQTDPVFDFGVGGYLPRWLAGGDQIAECHGGRLAALAGRRLTRTWVVWELEAGKWFADCPVVRAVARRAERVCAVFMALLVELDSLPGADPNGRVGGS